jgi:hypothetical protein
MVSRRRSRLSPETCGYLTQQNNPIKISTDPNFLQTVAALPAMHPDPNSMSSRCPTAAGFGLPQHCTSCYRITQKARRFTADCGNRDSPVPHPTCGWRPPAENGQLTTDSGVSFYSDLDRLTVSWFECRQVASAATAALHKSLKCLPDRFQMPPRR